MTEDRLKELREQTRRLCAERGLAIVPYGPAWWIVGEGVNRVFAELAGICPSDLEPLPVKRAKIRYRQTASREGETFFMGAQQTL